MILAERERLLADTSLCGRAWCEAWTAAIDRWLVGLYDNVFADATGVCLLAVGGTGRREMAPRSDIDVMVVHRGSAKKIEARLADLWYPIWDTGLHLGHAVRAANQKLSVSADHLDTATTMLAGRWIAGDRSLARRGVGRRRIVHGKPTPAHGCRCSATAAWPGIATTARSRSCWNPTSRRVAAVCATCTSCGGSTPPAEASPLETPRCWPRPTTRCCTPGSRCTGSRPIAGEVLRLEDQDAVAPAGNFGTADDLMAAVSSAARTLSWQLDRAWHAVARAADAAGEAATAGVGRHAAQRRGRARMSTCRPER